jgi:hypothetical protein
MGKQFLIGYNRDLMHRDDLTGSQHIATHSVQHTDGTRVSVCVFFNLSQDINLCLLLYFSDAHTVKCLFC